MRVLYRLLWCLWRFRRRLQSGQQMFLICFYAIWLDFSHPTHSWVSALVSGSDILVDLQVLLSSGIWPFDHLFGGSSFGLLISKFPPNYWGSPKFSEGLLLDCEQFNGNFDSWLLLFLSRDEEGFSMMLPFSPTGCLMYPPFLMFCEEKRKIEVIEDYFRSVLSFFITNLLFHLVTLQHIWDLPTLQYHKIMVIYPYPFLVVITKFPPV